MSLLDLIKPKEKVRKVKDEFVDKRPTPPKCTTAPKIPHRDRPLSVTFLKPLVPPKVYEEVKGPVTFHAWLKALLSKNPHYKYLYVTKSIYVAHKQYWFLNTQTNVTFVMSRQEIDEKIK